MNSRLVTETKPHQPVKPEYLKFSPTSTRYHRVKALAASLGCSWQDIVWEAVDQYLKQYSSKKV